MTLQDKATIVNDDIKTSFGGDTPLVDIVTNQADPLVNLVTTLLAGQSGVDDALAFLQSGLYASDTEGNDLTLVAQLSGTDRQIDQPSKAPIIVMGQAGAVLPAGSVLVDRQGAEWVTTLDATIQDCYGYTNACSPVGRFDLGNGELSLRDSFNNIDKATNAAAPSLGGSLETDEHLRNRLLGKRPQWQNKGTASALIWSLEQLAGVLKAKVITDLPDCFNVPCDEQDFKKYMIAVLGGIDAEIAETIFENLCFGTDRLIGSTSVAVRCDTVQFQSMCPAIVEVRYWLRCDCQSPEGVAELDQLISDRLNELSLTQDYYSSTDLCKVSKDLIKAEFRLVPKTMAPDCADCDVIFNNPITGQIDEEYCSSELNGHCYQAVCGQAGEFNDCVTLQPWWYPVFLPEYVTSQVGCPCPSPDEGCGCDPNAMPSPPVAVDDEFAFFFNDLDLTLNDSATPPATLDPTTIEFNLSSASPNVSLSGGNKVATLLTDGSSLNIDPVTGIVTSPFDAGIEWFVSYTIKDSNGLESNNAIVTYITN